MEVNKIIQADCFEYSLNIPDKSIDAIITDPPYNINYHSTYYKRGNPFDKIVGDTTFSYISFIEWYYNKLRDASAMFIFCSYKNLPVDDKIKNMIIWVKNDWSAGDLKGDFGNQYECILFLPKPDFILHSKRYSNVWQYDRVKPKYHPTEKPLDLMKRLIEVSTDENDLILDPFCGSGTTCLAAKIMKRRYTGIEIDKKYCKIARSRLKSML